MRYLMTAALLTASLAVGGCAAGASDAPTETGSEEEQPDATVAADALRQRAEMNGGTDFRLIVAQSSTGVGSETRVMGEALGVWAGQDDTVCVGATSMSLAGKIVKASACAQPPGAPDEAVALTGAGEHGRMWQIPDDAVSVEVVTPEGAFYRDPIDIAGVRILAVPPSVTVTDVYVTRADG